LFVEVVEKVWVAFSSSDQEEYHHGQIHLKVIEGLGLLKVSLKSELPLGGVTLEQLLKLVGSAPASPRPLQQLVAQQFQQSA